MVTIAWLSPLPLPRLPSPSPPRHPFPHHPPLASLRDSSPPTRRAFLKTLSVLTALSSLPASTPAVCGKPDPYFAHYLDWKEAEISIPPAQTLLYRVTGSRRQERKSNHFPILHLGDASVPHQAAEPLELLAGDNRRVLIPDLLVPSPSTPPETPAAPPPSRDALLARAAEQAIAAVRAEKMEDKFHIIAAGFGIQVAVKLLETTSIKPVSAVVEGWAAMRTATPSALLGERVCAVVAAEAADEPVVKLIYGGGKAGDSVRAVRALADVMPVLGMRMKGANEGELNIRGCTEIVFEGEGRLPHLEAEQACLEAATEFFGRVEDDVRARVEHGRDKVT